MTQLSRCVECLSRYARAGGCNASGAAGWKTGAPVRKLETTMLLRPIRLTAQHSDVVMFILAHHKLAERKAITLLLEVLNYFNF